MTTKSLYNVSSSPHIRTSLSTGVVMYDVILALLPATFFGVWHFGIHALLVILMSVASAVTAEFVFDYVTGKENTLKDGSAVVTGLLLALCLPPSVPLYIPYLGAVFAVVVVKGLFGGLGKNFMNPALGGRIFLLLSFGGTMTKYAVDGVTSATPLETLSGGGAVSVVQMWTGHAGGVIGCSALGLLIGGLFLWAADGITWHIPVATLVSFSAFLALFGGVTPALLLAHLAGGGVIMAAFFMATDPVTCPVTAPGQILYGILVGVLSGLFRCFGASADSVSYAVVLSNLAVPVIDAYIVPKPFAYRSDAADGKRNAAFWDALPRTAAALCGTVVVAGIVLFAVSGATSRIIEERRLADNIATYQAVLPESVSYSFHDGADAALADLDGGVYGTDFGNAYINAAVLAMDEAGNQVGCIISATSADGRDGPITVAVGICTDGTVSGIAFTELNETPGIGMAVGEAAFMDQFAGLPAGRLTLGTDVDAASGATISSTATVNAVNAALDFYAANMA